MKAMSGMSLVLSALVCLSASACLEEDKDKTKMVYVMSNEATGNQVVAFQRHEDGTLSFANRYATGGKGTGSTNVSTVTPQTGIDPLASQGSLAFSRSKRFLFAVNAGSGSVTSFKVKHDGTLSLVKTQDSGGAQPNCLDATDDLLYVAHVGSAGNNFDSLITGFRIEQDGRLSPINGSARKLSMPHAQPSRILFSPDGKLLVVSELSTNRLTTFMVNQDGTATIAVVANSAGPGPFGSVFLSDGRLLVAEAPASSSGALSSYAVSSSGDVTPISASVPNGQAATCWVMTAREGRYAYTSNTGSSTISLYKVADDGALSLVKDVASTVEGAGSGPIDSGVSEDSRFFYVLNGGKGSITAHAIDPDGALTRIDVATGQGLPSLGAQGLVVR